MKFRSHVVTSSARHTFDVHDVMGETDPKWGRTSRPIGGYGGNVTCCSLSPRATVIHRS
jgi:hypothetical protein